MQTIQFTAVRLPFDLSWEELNRKVSVFIVKVIADLVAILTAKAIIGSFSLGK